MAEMTGMLLALLYVSHASASCGMQEASVVEASEEGLVSAEEFPWVVSLQDSHHSHLAFGSILSEFWILSIASAFENRRSAVAVVGIAEMDATVISHEEYPVNTIILHKGFDNKTMTHNLALLKTDTAMQFNSLVQSICFLTRKLQMQLTLKNCWVAGWIPTSATGNHMTMSILRKIFVKEINLCPLIKPKEMGCGNHVEEETNTVCLGDPGNPMMCQLHQMNLWVLRGILSPGGERCPGLFLYIKVEDYSDWIMSKTKTTSLPLSAFRHWENSVPLHGDSARGAVTREKYSELGHAAWTQAPVQDQSNTKPSWSENSSREGVGIREFDSSLDMATPADVSKPLYYDYYDEQAGKVSSLGVSPPN
ncbi:inactive serine protease 54 [Saccopteryx leptura]|uniref:inactive serine protease 54 n=1 Tax=Saccopteryx leptura TaxID=249018 RepID=UPI00339BD941